MTLTRETVDDLVKRLLDTQEINPTANLRREAAAALLAAWEKMPDECGHPFCGPTCGSDPLLTRAEAAEAKLAERESENARLREALQQMLIEYDEVDLAEPEPPSMTSAVFAARAAIGGVE